MIFRELFSVVHLALADFGHEWRLSLCFVLALSAVLAPLLILFGLKFGLVTTIIDRADSPEFRQIRPIGAAQLDSKWFEEMAGNPGVEFVIPRTRNIAATIYVRNPKMRGSPRLDAELIPTAAGDPVLPVDQAIPTEPTSVILSNALAQKLNVVPGDEVEGGVSRSLDGKQERVLLTLNVIGVAPEAAFGRTGLFASLKLLLAIEDYRDGRAVPDFSWEGEPFGEGKREYAGYRMYAASLKDVAGLRDLLRGQGLEVGTRAAEIESMESLDRNLSFIFWVIAAIGGAGYLLSLGASLWAYVERKRRDLSILRLMGIRISNLVWFPIANAFFTSLLGTLVAVGAALAIAAVLNDVFVTSGSTSEFVCRLLPEHLAMGISITVLSAVLCSLLAAYHSTSIEPAEGLRDV